MVLKGPRQGLALRFFELTQIILSENNLELYEMEWNEVSGNLVIFIMNPPTKSAVLDDCVKVDRGFNPYVETETWIPENFNLEVSSPGIYRGLSQISHFQDVIGKEVQLHLVKKIDEEKYPEFPKALRNNLKIKVKLLEVGENGILVNAGGATIDIPFEQMKKANLETDISNHK